MSAPPMPAATVVAIVNVPELINLAVGQTDLNARLLNTVLHVIAGHISQLAGVRIQFDANTADSHAVHRTDPDPLQMFAVTNNADADAPTAVDQHIDLQQCTLQPLAKPDPVPVSTLVMVEHRMPAVRGGGRTPDIVEAVVPGAEDMISSVRSGNEKPLVKMMDLLNLTKRMEAAELSVAKLSSVLGGGGTAWADGGSSDDSFADGYQPGLGGSQWAMGGDNQTTVEAGQPGAASVRGKRKVAGRHEEGGSQPDAGGNQPAADGSQPAGADSNQSAAGGSQPAADGSQTAAGGSQPIVGGNQLDAGGSQPAVGGSKSAALGNQAASTSGQPSAATSRPTTASGQRPTGAPSKKAGHRDQDDGTQLVIDQIQKQMGEVQTQLIATEFNHNDLVEKHDNLDKLVDTIRQNVDEIQGLKKSTTVDEENIDITDRSISSGMVVQDDELVEPVISKPCGRSKAGKLDLGQLITVHRLVEQLTVDMMLLKARLTPEGSDAEAVARALDRLQLVTSHIQDDVCRLVSSVEDLLLFAEHTRGSLLDMVERIAELWADQRAVNQDVNMLVQERIDRRRQYEALIEQLEQVKCVKADRDEMELQLALKADIVDMRTKVSYAHFNAVTKDLSRGVVEAMERIVETDADWRREFESLLRLLAEKMDREVAEAVERKLNDKIAGLSCRLQEFIRNRQRNESAVAAKHFQHDLHCIACSEESRMRKLEAQPAVPRMARFGRARAEELARARRCASEMPRAVATVEQRFCGGTHTLTMAEERTSKKGDFIEQTGAIPRMQGVQMNRLEGTDGVLYRVEGNVVCDCE